MHRLAAHSMTTKRSSEAKPSSAQSTRDASKRTGPPGRSTTATADDFAAQGRSRVMSVGDHAWLVEGLRTQLAIADRIRIVGSLDSAAILLEETARLNPDVVLLDIEMPGPDAFEMADRLRHQQPRVRFIFLSAHVRDGYLAAAYKCGAWGYFAKGDD